jgi:hypothetical protein
MLIGKIRFVQSSGYSQIAPKAIDFLVSTVNSDKMRTWEADREDGIKDEVCRRRSRVVYY